MFEIVFVPVCMLAALLPVSDTTTTIIIIVIIQTNSREKFLGPRYEGAKVDFYSRYLIICLFGRQTSLEFGIPRKDL